MKALKVLLLGVALGAAAGAAAKTGDVIRFALPGYVELELVEVGGASQLPIEFLYTGKNPETLSRVTAPRYWIGRFEVMQKQYEAVMNDNPSPVKTDDRLPVTCVKWRDAVDFCDRLNQVCEGEIPRGYRFDLPTVVEWAHAFGSGTTNVTRYAGGDDLDKVAWHGVTREDGTVKFDALHIPGLKARNAARLFDMSGNAAEFVFVADKEGGNVRMGGSYMFPEKYCELGGTLVSRDCTAPDLGFRVALVPVDSVDPDGRTLSLGTKGRVLMRSGCVQLARKYLGEAMTVPGIAKAEAEALRQEWIEADRACGYTYGDWRALMTALADTLERNGLIAGEILRFYETAPTAPDSLSRREDLYKFYTNNHIYGYHSYARDLPQEVRSNLVANASTRVQTVLCDFTGDGLNDLVVELAGHVDGNGVEYGFFERVKGGGYRLVGQPVRMAGFCVIPGEDERIYFLALLKLTDEVLAPGVMDCVVANGKACLRVAWPLEKSFSLTELVDEKVHPRAPFMGKRNAARARNIASGHFERPLCWAWRR